jgi:hypothetical protein
MLMSEMMMMSEMETMVARDDDDGGRDDDADVRDDGADVKNCRR